MFHNVIKNYCALTAISLQYSCVLVFTFSDEHKKITKYKKFRIYYVPSHAQIKQNTVQKFNTTGSEFRWSTTK